MPRHAAPPAEPKLQTTPMSDDHAPDPAPEGDATPPEGGEPFSESLEEIGCTSCVAISQVRVVHFIDPKERPDLAEDLIASRINLHVCEMCGEEQFVDVPLRYVSHFGRQILQYMPWHLMESPEVVEQMLWENEGSYDRLIRGEGIRYFHSMGELVRAVVAQMWFLAHLAEKRKQFRELRIPEKVEARIRGAYKKRKLKVVYWASLAFEPHRSYEPREVDLLIWRRVSFLPNWDPCLDVDHLRSALCELGLLRRSPDGRRYWKEGMVER